jgi:hypothetical protein
MYISHNKRHPKTIGPQIHLVGVYLFPIYPISCNTEAEEITAARRMIWTSKRECSLSFATISICLSLSSLLVTECSSSFSTISVCLSERSLLETAFFLVFLERWDLRVGSWLVGAASVVVFGSLVEMFGCSLPAVASMASVVSPLSQVMKGVFELDIVLTLLL